MIERGVNWKSIIFEIRGNAIQCTRGGAGLALEARICTLNLEREKSMWELADLVRGICGCSLWSASLFLHEIRGSVFSRE